MFYLNFFLKYATIMLVKKMNIIGLIAEYNPFHNGHLYQINKIKEMYPDSIIVCVMSSSFSQRGEISVLNKWDKTEIALKNNIDIVLELPYFFTVQSSDIFAHAALQILNEFKIDTLVFGTETDNIDDLIKFTKNKKDDELFKEYMAMGSSYPASLSASSKNIINSPNDILATSYIREIIKNNYSIKPINIKRTNDYHDNSLNNSIVSASNIREKYYKGLSINEYVPSITNDMIIKNNIDTALYLNLLKYKINTDNSLNDYLDVTEGLDNKILNVINNSNSIDELIKNTKSKRYTYNRIYRMYNHILIGLKKTDVSNIKDIEYIRILGFNKNGRNYINKIKKDIKYEIIYNYNKKYITSKYELTSTKIYSLITNNDSLINKEYKKNVTII